MTDKMKILLFERQAGIAKAVAHPLRIAVIDFLKDGERCVCDIAEHVGSERSNISRHLAVMVHAGVLTQGRAQGFLQPQNALCCPVAVVYHSSCQTAGQGQ